MSGDTSDNIASRASLYVDKHPQIVILVVGGNDGLRGLSVENMKQNIVEIIDTFPESVIVLGGMELPLNLGMQYVKDFKNVYKEIASERKNIVFIESFLE